MKCASCYADNPYFMTVCASCGKEADPILVCPQGHVMAAGDLLCARCTTKWPEVAAFEGPKVLRGVVVALEGRMLHHGREVGLLELRDAETPIGFGEGRSPRDVTVTAGKDESILARLLIRPDGVKVCVRSGPGGPEERSLRYVGVRSGAILSIASGRLGIFLFDVPDGVGTT
jgi:hypothetical protein